MSKYELASIYRKAPDLLLDKMAEVSTVLAKQDQKTNSYKFWKSVSDVMKFCFGYMNDFHYILKENDLLRAENEFLKSMAADMNGRLAMYEGIKAEKLADTFDETVERVEKYLSDAK